MKKYYFAVLSAFMAILAVILFSFWRIHMRQLAYQREMLEAQVHNCGSEIEKNVLRFANEANYLLFTEDLTGIITIDSSRSTAVTKIEVVYSNYKDLIRNI